MARASRFVAIVGHKPFVDREDGVAMLLRSLGAEVRTIDLWDDPDTLFGAESDGVRALVVDAGSRPDVASLALRSLRKEPRLQGVGTLLAVTHDQVGRLDPANGFDDFVLTPIVPAELYARVRALEWRKAEFTSEERTKIGDIVIDRAAHEVTLFGALIALTSEGVCAALPPLGTARARGVPCRAPREGVGIALRGRASHGRHSRATNSREARLFARSGDDARSWLQAGRSGHGFRSTEDGKAQPARVGGSRVKGPIIAVSIGCPAGVGPEISVVSAAKARAVAPLLVGDPAVLERAMQLVGIDVSKLVVIDEASELRRLPVGTIAVHGGSRRMKSVPSAGKPSREAGASQLSWIDTALDLTRTGVADAMATAPVSKSVIAHSGAKGAETFRGHTEHLADRLGSKEVVMAFWSKSLVTSLVTTHLPLSRVPRAITAVSVSRALFWLTDLVDALGSSSPRIVVAALNPHAGEDGLLGGDEGRAIVPGIELARARLAKNGIDARIVGPMGAETAYRRATAGDFDGVVAMYHDQATIPMKLVAFGDAVNVTLGLSIVRTSVDHGTAYDIAGKGVADASAMRAALELASRIAAARRARAKS